MTSFAERCFWTAHLLTRARKVMDLPYYTPDLISAEQDRRVHRIVAHAYATVPFYRQVMLEQRLEPGDFHSADDLRQLPLVSKEQIQGEPELFISGPWRDRALPEWRTSGTTGRSLTVWYDRAYVMEIPLYNRREAAVWRRTIRGPIRCVAIVSSYSIVPYLGTYCTARLLRFRPGESNLVVVPLESPPDAQAVAIDQLRPNVLVSYASPLERLWLYQQATGRPRHIPSVIYTVASGLAPKTREQIERTWDTRIYSRYGTAETIKVGFECEQREGFHLHSDRCAVRVVD